MSSTREPDRLSDDGSPPCRGHQRTGRRFRSAGDAGRAHCV